MAGTKKILLVEDDNNLREIYGARLQAEGYEIVSAPDGENALAIAVKEKPDLIISDIMMPKVSGFDMLDILRNAPETKDTKVIMMTALSQAEDKARADKLGADMYLVKSQVTLEDVTKAVHKILDDPTESTQEADTAAAQEMIASKDAGSASKQTQEEQAPTPPPVQTSTKKPAKSPAQATPAKKPTPPQQPADNSQPQPQPEPQKQEPIQSAVPVVAPPVDDPASSAITPPKPVVAKVPDTTSQPTNPVESTTDDKASGGTSIPVSIVSDDKQADTSPPVEPNLAQALKDEEKAVQEKIENFEKTAQKPPDNTDDTTVQDPPSSANSPSVADDQPKNPLDDKQSKRVIKPINDPTKGPDINELVAKEEAKETAKVNEPGQTNQVIKPQTSDNSDSTVSNETTSDDFGKISL